MKLARPCSAVLLTACCASIAAVSAAPAWGQTTIDAEWDGSALGLWYNPLDPVQFRLDAGIFSDWEIPGPIEVGDMSFQTIMYPNNVPGVSFNVEIANALLTVAPLVPIRVSDVTFGGLASGVTVEAGGSWGIMMGTVDGGTIGVNILGVDSVFTDLTVNGTATFTGGGSITLGDAASSRVTGGVATTFTNVMVLEDYTLSGGGQLGNESMSLRVLADGIVRADATNPLNIDPGPGFNVVNMGLLESADGGTLHIRQTAIVNTGGTIRAGNASAVELFDLVLTGGTLDGSGVIRGNGLIRLENTIINNGFYTVTDGGLTILDGDMTNTGRVTIAGGSFLFNNDTSLTGGGSYILGTGSSTSALAGTGGMSPTVTNVDNTVRGGGNILISTFINQSAVIADEPGDPLRFLSPSVENQGTMSAVGAELNIRSGAFDNTAGALDTTAGTIAITHGATVTGGLIDIDGSSTLLLDNGSILGGAVVTNSAGGTIVTDSLGGKIDGILHNPDGGIIRITNDSELILFSTGTYNNAGMIDLDGSGPFASFANTSLQADGDVLLEGGGAIDMGTSGDGILMGRAGTTSSFTNMDNTITGSGAIRLINSFTNHALIHVNNAPTGVAGSGILFFEPGSGQLFNTGVIQASNGGTIDLDAGTYQNTNGTIQALNGSTINIRPGAALIGGTIRTAGSGTVEIESVNVLFDGVGMEVDANVNVQTLGRLRLRGDITNRQTISILGAGQLLIDGTVTLTGGGTIDLTDPTSRIFGFGGGDPDLLNNVDNTLTGTGEIRVAVQNAGTLVPGNSPGTLTTLDYTQTADGKLQIELLGEGAGEFDILNVLGTADLGGTLEVFLLPGLDITAGTTFDILTAQSVTGTFDTVLLPTDIGGEDLLSLEQVGNTYRLTALQDINVPIPEPGTAALLGLALLGVSRRRRTG